MTVKVADFGLSRDVYVTDYYVISHSNPLPVKWLAPEALFDKRFSEKTDVVSISILSNTLIISLATQLHLVHQNCYIHERSIRYVCTY